MDIEKELNQRIDEVLYYVWDPVGVNDFGPATRDEYSSYVPNLTKAILNEVTVTDIEKALYKIETEEMEVYNPGEVRKAVAEQLVDWYIFLKRNKEDSR